ncbi:hypothetical protein EDD11_005704 [Mortierella claussenii]|nr:hypothetical protein EDD11_005704 [Mortierella claussenii]
MSDSGSAQPGAKRSPKVGVYVPRHRRGNDDTSAASEAVESRPNATNVASTSSRQSKHGGIKSQRGSTRVSRDSFGEEGSSSRSGSSSTRDVQRRGRGKFMGPAGSSSTELGGNEGSDGSATATAPRNPRGRDFDATILRRYSDDESRPNTSFTRSGSYNSGRSSNANNSGYSSSSHTSGGRASNMKRSDRADEGSWRKRDVDKVENQHEVILAVGVDVSEDVESGLTDKMDQIKLEEQDSKKDEAESSEELEEWELALQDSDEDAIPRIEAPKAPKAPKPHPAEHLLESPSMKPSTTGNWSEGIDIEAAISNDDMYILELYDFSPSIKTMHLTDMFSVYENRSGGFRIKWLDDTKALAIFESAAVAKQAYIANLTNQIAKIKPYAGADRDTIRNAGGPSSGAFNGVRPAKTDSVARRLVQGALGLRVRRTPEQIAEEKALVQAAKVAREAQRQEQQRQRQEMDAIFNS